MSNDVALFISSVAMISIVFLIVKNHQGASDVIRNTGDAATGFYGTLLTGNPQFYERARGIG